MRRHRNRYLALIGGFRILKSVALVAGGIAALRMEKIVPWLAPLASDHEVVRRALAFVTRMSPERKELIAVAAFAYGATMAAEGVGLLMQKRWAEWLTIIVTASFIPFEIAELVHRVTAVRVALLVANAVILAYLIVRRVRKR